MRRTVNRTKRQKGGSIRNRVNKQQGGRGRRRFQNGGGINYTPQWFGSTWNACHDLSVVSTGGGGVGTCYNGHPT